MLILYGNLCTVYGFTAGGGIKFLLCAADELNSGNNSSYCILCIMYIQKDNVKWFTICSYTSVLNRMLCNVYGLPLLLFALFCFNKTIIVGTNGSELSDKTKTSENSGQIASILLNTQWRALGR